MDSAVCEQKEHSGGRIAIQMRREEGFGNPEASVSRKSWDHETR